MRVAILLVLAIGAALATGGTIFAVMGFGGARVAVSLYLIDCVVPQDPQLCSTLRTNIGALDALMIGGLVLAFLGADLLVLGLLFQISPTMRRILPAPH